MLEWLKRHAWKACRRQKCHGGSNPPLSAQDSKKTLRAFSSAGSEHLPYKQRVGGSNPSTPTTQETRLTSRVFFCPLTEKSRTCPNYNWCQIGFEWIKLVFSVGGFVCGNLWLIFFTTNCSNVFCLISLNLCET